MYKFPAVFIITAQSVFPVIQSRRMRWEGHLAHMGKGEVSTGLWWGDPRERDNLEDLSLDGWIILKWIFNTWNGEACTGLI
jgi:hypothetical protein